MTTVLSWVGVISFLMLVGWLLMASAKPTQEAVLQPDPLPKFPGRYAEFYQTGEVEIESYYQYCLTQLGELYIHRRFFPETRTLTHYEEFTDYPLSTLHGRYESYWDSGKPKTLGRYHRGEAVGHWESYRFDGSLEEEGEYTDGGKTGDWLSFHPNQELRATHPYVDGALHGTVTEYDSTGVVVSQTAYVDGTPVEESEPLASPGDFAYNSVGADQPEEVLAVVETMPLFPGCRKNLSYPEHKACADQRFLKFIYKNLQYPPRARQNGVRGSASVSFVIEADGAITTIRVLDGLSQDITDELIRLVKLMPPWIPGTQDGSPVRVLFNLPLNFS